MPSSSGCWRSSPVGSSARCARPTSPGGSTGRPSPWRFAVRHLDLDSAMLLAGRLQRALSDPIAAGGFNIHPTVSIGFALPGRLPRRRGDAAPGGDPRAHRGAAERAGRGAQLLRFDARPGRDPQQPRRRGGGRARPGRDPGPLPAPGLIRTGAISGFEALARWHHPTRGLIPPIEFLPALEQAGLMARLGERMIQERSRRCAPGTRRASGSPAWASTSRTRSSATPGSWTASPGSSTASSSAPDRLVVEVLETVVAGRSDDVVIRNLAGLARLGCCLDLDDFGTGHASITSIRRFSIERIKIDRSFVTRIDEDAEQQRMVSAILTMAERLGLDTLAEGVETEAERAMLARLGCGHVQGFGIARPMPVPRHAGLDPRLGGPRGGAAAAPAQGRLRGAPSARPAQGASAERPGGAGRRPVSLSASGQGWVGRDGGPTGLGLTRLPSAVQARTPVPRTAGPPAPGRAAPAERGAAARRPPERAAPAPRRRRPHAQRAGAEVGRHPARGEAKRCPSGRPARRSPRASRDPAARATPRARRPASLS